MSTFIIEIKARFKGTENLTSEQLQILLNQLEISDMIALIRPNNVTNNPIILKSDTFDITIK